MGEATARVVGTVGIWAGAAVILAFGVFRTNWNGDLAMLFLFLIVVIVCAAAGLSTAAVWGWRPARPPSDSRPEAPLRAAQESNVWRP
ncbi:MAG TPA: hypothetical protein VFE78_35670 [Gemmataceae bacterium]|jgi:hypothetical protein|nr:hypothetical protein [Gemmataceae bacterium]